MTYDPAIPYVLGLIIVVAGVMPALFLPETLVFAKARKLAQPNATSTGSSETAEAPGKQGVLQELIHQAREFKDSTKFIWLDTNVRSMVFISFVCVMYRQTTNVLLQYASKKFNWSLARVSTVGIEVIFSHTFAGQSSHLRARDRLGRQLSRSNAIPNVSSCEVLEHARKISRLAS